MKRLSSLVVATAFGIFGLSGPVAADHFAYDLDCYQFATWGDAQATYEHILVTDGWDWMILDDDYDGIACECLYYGYPCWTP